MSKNNINTSTNNNDDINTTAIIIIAGFSYNTNIKIINNKTLMNQLTEHLTKQKITSTDQLKNQENKFLIIIIS